MLFAADCCSVRPWLRQLYPGQPWRNGGAQDCPSALLGAGPGKATLGKARRDQAQGSRKPPRGGSSRLWLWVCAAVVGGPKASLQLPPGQLVSEAVARFVGCLGLFCVCVVEGDLEMRKVKIAFA